MIRLLSIFIVTCTLISCSGETPEVKCIQFVHIGTSDRLNFSSVLSVKDDWCQINIESHFDTLSIKKKIVDRQILSSIDSFSRNSSYKEKLDREQPYSGYEITFVYDDETSIKRFLLSRKENEEFFSELIEYLEKNNLPNDILKFINEIKERGYFFYG